MKKQKSEESRLNSDTAGQLKLSMLAAACVKTASIVIAVAAAEMNKNVICVKKYKTVQKCLQIFSNDKCYENLWSLFGTFKWPEPNKLDLSSVSKAHKQYNTDEALQRYNSS